MAQEHKTVFISYRRNVAAFIARSVFQNLHFSGYDVFMDVESIDSGNFEQIIFNQVEARAHFLVILTPGTIERYENPNDMMRREIEYAMEKQRNIVPLLVNDFKFNDDTAKYLTGKLANLPSFNGLSVPHDYFDEAMERLRKRFLKQPVVGAVKAAPASEQPTVQEKIDEAAAQPTPTPEQLSAEGFFSRAYQKDESGDLDGAIADYSEAIRLNPQYAEAYYNRGIAHYGKDDFDGAIADCNEAIRLNPQYANAYIVRGIAHANKGDFDGATADYSEAIRLNPQYAEAYSNRGVARYSKGDLDGATADYSEAIRLNPQYAEAYSNRGNARQAKGDLDGAIADYSEAIRLNPQYAEIYNNRGESYFAKGIFKQALDDFRQANSLKPANNVILGGMAITQYALGQKGEAKRIWRSLLAQDERYKDAEWVGKKFNWHPTLIEAARKLIAEL